MDCAAFVANILDFRGGVDDKQAELLAFFAGWNDMLARKPIAMNDLNVRYVNHDVGYAAAVKFLILWHVFSFRDYACPGTMMNFSPANGRKSSLRRSTVTRVNSLSFLAASCSIAAFR